MVAEEFLVQSAVSYFMHSWMNGLRSELAIKTLHDGKIPIDVRVQSLPSQSFHSSCAPRHKQSGQRSRRRRKERRTFNSTDTSSSIVSEESTMVKHRTAVKEEPVIVNGNHVPLAAFNNDKIDVNAEIDFEVQQITNLPYQNQGFQDVPSSNDRNEMGSTYPENNIGDLIQLDDPLPISNELHLKK